MSKVIYIYALVDPITFEYKYIGKTDNLKTRLSNHLNHGGKNELKNKWIGDLKNKSLLPIIKVIEETTNDIALDRESFYISTFIRDGGRLFNRNHQTRLLKPVELRPNMSTDDVFNYITSKHNWYRGIMTAQAAFLFKRRYKNGLVSYEKRDAVFNSCGFVSNSRWVKIENSAA